MQLDMEPWIYLVTGAALAALYYMRSKALKRIAPDTLPELDNILYFQLKTLLETAYERTLFLATVFLVLTLVTFSINDPGIKSFLLLVAVVVFFFNIRPRHNAMKLLLARGLDLAELRKRGISL